MTPGITIRDRLGVLRPEREDSYYRERDLVPPDLWDAFLQAQVQIVNYHTFLPRDSRRSRAASPTPASSSGGFRWPRLPSRSRHVRGERSASNKLRPGISQEVFRRVIFAVSEARDVGEQFLDMRKLRRNS